MNIFIDPAYNVYYQNELFNAQNELLNRDDTLAPFIRMRAALNAKNLIVNTADYLLKNQDSSLSGDYYSFGLLDNIDVLSKRKNISLKAFVVFEPPVVAPELYKSLSKLTALFEAVYVHNTIGDGYSLNGVDTAKLKKLYWPQPYDAVIDKYWHKSNRLHRIVVINGNHRPKSLTNELYSKRIEVITQLKKINCVDLYGRGWSKWWSRSSMWLPYWKNRNALMSVYHGACSSKHDILSQYDFSLCFENMYMDGYITEKIFDCFYAGTVPIYMGAKNIEQLIPINTYIDFRNYKNISELENHLINMSTFELTNYKESARNFIQSKDFLSYRDSICEIVGSHSIKKDYYVT